MGTQVKLQIKLKGKSGLSSDELTKLVQEAIGMEINGVKFEVETGSILAKDIENEFAIEMH